MRIRTSLPPGAHSVDISGAAITLENKDVKSLNLNYAMGWNFDEEGYRKIRQGDTVGNCMVVGVASTYHIQYSDDALYSQADHPDGLPGRYDL